MLMLAIPNGIVWQIENRWENVVHQKIGRFDLNVMNYADADDLNSVMMT